MSAARPGMRLDAGELARRVAGEWLTAPGDLTVTAVEIGCRPCRSAYGWP